MALGACGSLDPFDAFFDTSPVEPERVTAAPPADETTKTPDIQEVPVEPLRRPSRQAERQELERSLSEDTAEALREPPREPGSAPELPRALPDEPNLPAMPEPPGGVDDAMNGAGVEPQDSQAPAEGPPPNQAVSVFNVEDALAGAGQAAAARGAPTAVIYFGHGSSNLNGHDRDILREVVQLRAGSDSALRVIGHSSSRAQTMDPVTHGEANLDISLRRAENVAEVLASLGVSRQHIRVEGRADRDPVYYEFMETGEAGNRRAEVFLETR